jgi:hypothetical protein
MVMADPQAEFFGGCRVRLAAFMTVLAYDLVTGVEHGYTVPELLVRGFVNEDAGDAMAVLSGGHLSQASRQDAAALLALLADNISTLGRLHGSRLLRVVGLDELELQNLPAWVEVVPGTRVVAIQCIEDRTQVFVRISAVPGQYFRVLQAPVAP